MLESSLKLEDFDFNLPDELIAKYPCDKRDQSRMLVFNKETKKIQDHYFKNIIDYINPGDLIVRNKSKVLPARFFVQNTQDTKIEILILEKKENVTWLALAKPAKRLKEARSKYKIEDTEIEIYKEDGRIFVDFLSAENFQSIIQNISSMPIPPYFKREAEELDKERYQTIYAKEHDKGYSAAAPTAGLHFTEEIFEKLKEKNIEVIDLTLHVGLGTFAPVKVENIKDHKMHSEYYEVAENDWKRILEAKQAGNKIFAIGSTSTRTLETVFREQKLEGKTDIYIYPGFEFQIVDAMLTNFHLPKSSLIMMISAFIGLDNVKNVYEHAIAEKYRFYSYGDCCLFI